MPSDAVIDKWLGEPIKAAILPTSIFLTNKKGFPVLSKAHQRIIFRLFKVIVKIITIIATALILRQPPNSERLFH